MSELVCKTLKLLVENADSFVSAVKNIFDTKTMATLKISDLSVGDWVSFDTAYLTVEGDDIATAFVKKLQQSARIKSILGDQELIFAEVETEDDFGTIYLKMEHIRPIPITAEILERNGLVKNGEYNEWSTGNWDDIPFIGISLSRPSMRIKNLGTDIFLNNKVVYVHDLQHALRLAGVHKEINL